MIEISRSAYDEKRTKILFENMDRVISAKIKDIKVFQKDYEMLLKPLAAHARSIGICYKSVKITPYSQEQ